MLPWALVVAQRVGIAVVRLLGVAVEDFGAVDAVVEDEAGVALAAVRVGAEVGARSGGSARVAGAVVDVRAHLAVADVPRRAVVTRETDARARIVVAHRGLEARLAVAAVEVEALVAGKWAGRNQRSLRISSVSVLGDSLRAVIAFFEPNTTRPGLDNSEDAVVCAHVCCCCGCSANATRELARHLERRLSFCAVACFGADV